MKMHVLAILLLLCMVAPSYSLTMDEAVQLALKNNHLIQEQRELYAARLEGLDSEKAAFLPGADLRYSFTRQDNVFSFFQTKSSSVFAAEVSYNLFNGFRDISAVRSARARLDASLYERKALEEDVILGVKRSFLSILRAQAGLATAQEAVTLLEQQRHDAALFLREGLIAKNDLLKVEVELASVRQGLLQAESGLSIAKRTLARVIGVQRDESEPYEELPLPAKGPFSEEELRDEMLSGRSELRFLEARKRERTHVRESLKGGYFPAVDLTFTHERFGDSHVPDGRDGLFDTQTMAVITATWNIFDGLRTKHDIRSEEAEIRALEERISDTKDELTLQLRMALEGFRVSQGKREVAESAVQQAEENYRITQNQFRQRVATVADLLDARVFLTRARSDHFNALYDLHQSIAEIERVVEKRK